MTTQKSDIQKPMLAGTLPIDFDVKFPVLATPKIDGIRCLKVNGKIVSRTFKPIPNKFIRDTLEKLLPDNADGEISYGNTFQEVTSTVMTSKGSDKALEKPFTFYWFDYVPASANMEYTERMKMMKSYYTTHKKELESLLNIVKIEPLYPELITNTNDLTKYENKCLSDGFEGIMIRKPEGIYKYGRSTLREGLLIKIKRFMDAEATIVDTEELMHNMNEAKHDVFGHTKRSSHKDNKLPSGVLGAFVVKSTNDVTFKIGTGFTAEQREEFWKKRKSLVGKLVKYKYLEIGVKDAPRHPVFLGFRSSEDI